MQYIKILLLTLFGISIIGYILSVLKEKFLLKNNIIVINKKSVTQDHINQAEMKEFILNGNKIKAGDEVKFLLKSRRILKGIIIGAKRKDRSIFIVTYKDEVKKICIDSVKKFKIVSKYGKFFKTF